MPLDLPWTMSFLDPEILSIFAACLAFAGGLVLWVQIKASRARMNVFTWGLWSLHGQVLLIMGVLSSASTFWFPVSFTAASCLVLSLTLHENHWKVERPSDLETLCIAGVCGALFTSCFYGEHKMLFSAALTIPAAALPQVRDAFDYPFNMRLAAWVLFALGGFLGMVSVAAAGPVYLSAYFYPAAVTLASLLVILVAVIGYVLFLTNPMRSGR